MSISGQLFAKNLRRDLIIAHKKNLTDSKLPPTKRIVVTALVGLTLVVGVTLGTSPKSASANRQIDQTRAMLAVNWDRQGSSDEENPSVAPPSAPTPAPAQPDPSSASQSVEQGGMVTHVVENGETLRTLAKRYQVSRESIRQASNLKSDTLQVGQQLLIPVAVDSSTGAQDQSDAASTDNDTAVSDAADDSRRTASAVSSRGGTRSDAEPSQAPALDTPDPPADAANPAASAPVQDDFGSRVVQTALQLVGSRYRWAGISPSTGFDCSGLVYYVYQQVGRPIPRTQWPQLAAGPQVSRDEMQPGDIIYFANTYVRGLSHEGIYIGDGEFVHADSEGVGVIVSSLSNGYWMSRYYAANRP